MVMLLTEISYSYCVHNSVLEYVCMFSEHRYIVLYINVMLLLPPPPSALVWGSSVKHNPQSVDKDHVLQDEDVVQIVKK